MVLVICRLFVGEIGVDPKIDHAAYPEGFWFRDEQNLIRFSPDRDAALFPPHPDMNHICTGFEASGHHFTSDEKAIVGPYRIYKVVEGRARNMLPGPLVSYEAIPWSWKGCLSALVQGDFGSVWASFRKDRQILVLHKMSASLPQPHNKYAVSSSYDKRTEHIRDSLLGKEAFERFPELFNSLVEGTHLYETWLHHKTYVRKANICNANSDLPSDIVTMTTPPNRAWWERVHWMKLGALCVGTALLVKSFRRLPRLTMSTVSDPATRPSLKQYGLAVLECALDALNIPNQLYKPSVPETLTGTIAQNDTAHQILRFGLVPHYVATRLCWTMLNNTFFFTQTYREWFHSVVVAPVWEEFWKRRSWFHAVSLPLIESYWYQDSDYMILARLFGHVLWSKFDYRTGVMCHMFWNAQALYLSSPSAITVPYVPQSAIPFLSALLIAALFYIQRRKESAPYGWVFDPAVGFKGPPIEPGPEIKVNRSHDLLETNPTRFSTPPGVHWLIMLHPIPKAPIATHNGVLFILQKRLLARPARPPMEELIARHKEVLKVVLPTIRADLMEDPKDIREIISEMPSHKRARHVRTVEAFERGCWNEKHRSVGVFMKTDEKLFVQEVNGHLTIKPRAIVNPPSDDFVRTAPFVQAAVEVLKKSWNGQQTFRHRDVQFRLIYCSGMTQSQLTALVPLFSTGDVIIMQAGDDSAGRRRDGLFFENDFSMFDSSQNEQSRFSDDQFFLHLGIPTDVRRVLWDSYGLPAVVRLTYSGAVFSCPRVSRTTGGSNTTLSNTFQGTCANLAAEVMFPDQDATSVHAAYGFSAKVQTHQGFVGTMTFLKGWYLPTPTDVVWIPLPSCILKAGGVRLNPCTMAHTKDVTEAVAQVLFAIAQNIPSAEEYPVVSAYRRWCLRYAHQGRVLSSAVNESVFNKPTLDLPTRFEWDRIAELMTRRYGVSVQDLREAETLLDNAGPPPVSLNHSVFKRFAKIDYGAYVE